LLPISSLAAIRWLPLTNQSGTTIPPFACLRIVGAALDSTGQLIYSVDQPNGDASASYMFNGSMAVAAGAAGSGTLDFPCQAIWDAGTPAVADVWGPQAGQWTLTKNGSPGFPVLSVVDRGTSRMLVGSPSAPVVLFEAPIYGTPLVASAPSAEVSFAGAVPIYGSLPPEAAFPLSVSNDFSRSGAIGQLALVAEDAAGNYRLLAVAGGPGGCTFTLQGDLSSGSASATVIASWGGAPAAAASTITVNDPLGLFARALGPSSATYAAQGEAIYDPLQGYVVTACDQETLKYRCLLDGTMTYDGTSGVTGLMPMNARPFGQARTAAIGPANPLAYAGQNSSAATIEWNAGANQWEFTGVQNYKQTEVTGVQLSGLNLQTRTRDAVGMFNGSETGYATSGTVPSTGVTAVVGESFAGGTLSYTTQSLTVLGTGTAAPPTTLFSTVSLAPITSLQYYSSTHNFQDKTTPITAIDPSFAATSAAREGADWSNWAATVKADPLTAVNWSGSNVLSQTTTDMYLMEVGSAGAPTSAGSLATTTATIVSGVQYSGGALQYQTQTLTVLATAAPSGWSSLFTTASVTAVVGLSYTAGALQSQTQSFTAINPGAASGYSSWATMSTVNLVSNVSYGSLTLSETIQPIYAWTAGGTSNTTVTSATACPTS